MLNELQFKDIISKGKHFGNMAACAGRRSALRRLRRASCEICESLSPSHGHRGNRTSVSLKPSAITVWSDQLLMPFKWDLHDHWEKPFRDQMSVVPSTLSFHSNSCWKNWNSWIILTPPNRKRKARSLNCSRPPFPFTPLTNHIRDHLEANLESKDRKHFMNQQVDASPWRDDGAHNSVCICESFSGDQDQALN